MGDGDYPISSLIDAAAAGDERAWHEIVDRYAPLLASVIRRFRLNAAETQDVAQTVWLRLVEHMGSLRQPQALPMWIITTAKRESLRSLAERQRTVPYDPLDPSWMDPLAEDAEPDTELLRADRHQALLAGLAELPARQRELLLLLVEDPPLSYEQISQRTGIPTGSIGPTRGRALERLRQTAVIRDHLIGLTELQAAAETSAYRDPSADRDLDQPRAR
jgi:RNA polymerase sigma factor (sigma-70 family)